jgi:hypothetical protein
MSEFSESYHLFSSNQEEGISLLRNAGIRGFVFPEENKLLHYIFAEDHGWSLSIFERTTKTFHYDCSWDEGVGNNYQEINKNKIVEIINRNPSRKKEASKNINGCHMNSWTRVIFSIRTVQTQI